MGVPYAEVIGDPVAHSKSPLIHRFWLERLGLEGEYRATRVTAAELPAYLDSRRADPDWRGCNVTMPHKTEAAALMDGLLPDATVTRAANIVLVREGRLIGRNTDLRGFAEPLGDEPRNRARALVIGTGAVARTAFVALAALDVQRIDIAGRNRDRALALLASYGQQDRAPVALDRPLPAVDLLVNASAGGMAGQAPLDVDISALPPSAIIYDMVYQPLETALLAQARARGLRTIDGIDMLIGQAAASFSHFFGEAPPRTHDTQLRELLTS